MYTACGRMWTKKNRCRPLRLFCAARGVGVEVWAVVISSTLFFFFVFGHFPPKGESIKATREKSMDFLTWGMHPKVLFLDLQHLSTGYTYTPCGRAPIFFSMLPNKQVPCLFAFSLRWLVTRRRQKKFRIYCVQPWILSLLALTCGTLDN